MYYRFATESGFQGCVELCGHDLEFHCHCRVINTYWLSRSNSIGLITSSDQSLQFKTQLILVTR